MPTYYLAGVMYINGCEGNDQRVLIPDGKDDPKIQLPLRASILVAKADWLEHTFGTEAQDRVLTVGGQPKEFVECFLTKRSRISVPHAGGAQCFNLDTGLPRAQKAGFKPDLATPDTVAEIELNGGSVTARSLAGIPIVEWRPGKRNDGLKDDEPITITATLLDDQRQPTAVTQTLTVRHDAAVVFVHSNDLFAVADDSDQLPGSSSRSSSSLSPFSSLSSSSSSSSTSGSSSGSEPKERPQSRRTILDRAALYTKISHHHTPVDPDKLARNYDPEIPQPDIPSTDQADVLKALPERPGWLTSDVPWCCAPDVV